jgi:hypothetical protein
MTSGKNQQEEAERDNESGTRAFDLPYFKDQNNFKRQLEFGMAFVLYWRDGNGDWYYPVGLWDGKDFSPKDGVGKSELLRCRIRGTGPQFECSWREDAWRKPVQRKGQNHYIAYTGSDNTMRTINGWWAEEEGVRFYIHFDIEGAGDAWISDDHTTGSIRMKAHTTDRGPMVAVRYGTGQNDQPFGSVTRFVRRSWSNDLSRHGSALT